jgi:tetratricopeptide (TPR) repeat protein
MLAAFLPRLRELLAANDVLIVLDNLETLLTPEGTWRDPRWGLLLTALAGPHGASRVIMTSRVVPAGLDGERGGGGRPGAALSPLVTLPADAMSPGRLVTLPVHALSLDESVALARELPNLRALLHADPGPLRAAAVLDVNADRDRVLRVLRVVQGHPKLLDLADAAARSRETLDAQLAAAEAAAADRRLEAFFHAGTSDLDPEQFLAALSGWATTALAALPEPARLMAEFLACLEDRDLMSYVIERNWKDLHRRLNRPGDPPPSAPLLNELAAAALIEPAPAEPRTLAADGAPDGPSGPADDAPDGPQPTAYRIHPGVAAAIAAAARPGLREAVDAELAAFWTAAAHLVAESEGSEGGEKSWLMVRAGLAAAPYLLRRGEWNTAVSLLDQALRRDGSPGTAQEALPTLRRVAVASGRPEALGVLARALSVVNPPEAEQQLRAAADATATDGDYRAASGIAGDLVALLMNAGRLDEALVVARQKADYTGQAGLGPWTLLADQTRLLQLQVLKGDHEQVLAKVTELRAAMAGLPDPPVADEAVTPWDVREVLLDTGHSSALATGDWERCLELNAEITASRRQRGAGTYEVTVSRFNDAGPLIRLGRLDEAQRLLSECQDVAEEHADTAMLTKILSTRAVVAKEMGYWQAAADLERAALRLCYTRPEAEDIAISHHNLASYLMKLDEDRTGRRAHWLAAGLIRLLAGMIYDAAHTVRVLAAELRETQGEDRPWTVARVVETAELTEGVRLGALLASLEPYPQVVEEALTRLLSSAAGINERESAASVRDDGF